MSTRNLEFLFKPASVALITADPETSAVGAVIARNLSTAGFPGMLWAVAPHGQQIGDLPTFSDLDGLPRPPDLAVLVTAPDYVAGLIAALGSRGTRAVAVVTGTWAQDSVEHARGLCSAMLNAARPYLLRFVGPHSLGLMVPGSGLNASFAHTQPLPGNLAFVAQSSAVLTAVLDWATSRNIGFSHLVSLGEMADVDFGDLLDYLTGEQETKAILLYLETVTQARKFMSAARAAARVKPVVVLKGGRYPEGNCVALTHRGGPVGPDAVYDAAFRRAGMLRVYTIQELFAAVETLGMARTPAGDRLAIVTNGGGIGLLASDALIDEGGHLAAFTPASIVRLQALLPEVPSPGNPLDLGGGAPGSRYADALEVLLGDTGVDAVLLLNCPNAIVSGAEIARAVIDTSKRPALKSNRRGVFTSWLGDGTAAPARQLFAANRIPSYETPDDAVRGIMQIVRYRRNQEMLMQTPPSIPEGFSPDSTSARQIIEQALREDRQWLTEIEAKQVVADYGIPVVATHAAATAEEAATAAAQIGAAVTLKILSPDIAHPEEVGGVFPELETPELVREAANALRERFGQACPAARLQGFTVQPVIRRLHAHQLLVGILDDARFGPVVRFGHGGYAARIIQDQALALPPLNLDLAREVMARTRIHRLLEGGAGLPAADLANIAFTLVKISQLACDIAAIAELEINPLCADANGVLALDVRIRVVRTSIPAVQRLAICPYPKELEEPLTLPDGLTMLLRPIRPEDEPLYQKLFARLSPEEVLLRFLSPMRTLSHSLAARLTQIDYDREMALVLIGQNSSGETELYGGARIIADPNNERAEFAILLRGDMTGKGLGPMLMRRIIDLARNRGIKEVFGDVSSENRAMLKLCQVFGFTRKRMPDDPGVLSVTLKL